MDEAKQTTTRSAQRRDEDGHRHEKLVLEAMTTRERALTLLVLSLNLGLGAWLIGRADFSQVLPNARVESVADTPATTPEAPGRSDVELVRAERSRRQRP